MLKMTLYQSQLEFKYFPGQGRKCPFSGGKVPFAFVKNVVQIAFLPQWPLINANISGEIF
jgi:hypothetical protein